MKELIPYFFSAVALILALANSFYARRRDTKGDWQKELDKLQKEIEEEIKELAEECTYAAEKRTETEATLKVLSMKMDLYWNTVVQHMAKKFGEQ